MSRNRPETWDDYKMFAFPYDWDDEGNMVWKVVASDGEGAVDEVYVDLFSSSSMWTVFAAAVNSHFEEEVKHG